MTTLETFVLVGTILSFDSVFSTVEFDMNPPANGGPSVAILPNQAIPCEIEVGKKVYVVKDANQEYPTISCELSDNKQ